jgi:hypothetical protein
LCIIFFISHFLQPTASEDACIFTNVEYENFIIDLEFKNEKGTSGGVIVYSTDRVDWIPNSVEVQIADDYYFVEEDWTPNYLCGGVFGHLPPTSKLVKKEGEWNQMNIRCEGQRITIKLNGEVTADMDMAQWTSGTKNPDGSEIPPWLPTPFAELPTKGYIGLQVINTNEQHIWGVVFPPAGIRTIKQCKGIQVA